MTTIIDAIKSLDSNAQVTVSNEDINEITWHDDNPNSITVEQIKTKQDELLAEHTSQEYARKRKVEYDALNQFELMTDDAANGTTTHADAINAIKTKYPKP